ERRRSTMDDRIGGEHGDAQFTGRRELRLDLERWRGARASRQNGCSAYQQGIRVHTRYSRPMSTAMASCSGGAVQGQIVLVLQGGGALGAYQVGVYQALHEAGLEPDWVIGTSIGAINGGLIAGNRLQERLARLAEFWDKLRLPPMVNPKFAATFCGFPAFLPRRALPWAVIYPPLVVFSPPCYAPKPL